MRRLMLRFAPFVVAAAVLGVVLYAQSPTIVTFTTPSNIVLMPISATAGAAATTTLTIPAPPSGMYNYVCYLAYEVGNNNTGAVVTNVVSTSTNFNAFAVKTSMVATNSADSGVQVVFNLSPATGCAKSAAPSTATTFVGPVGATGAAWTWYATYYQGL
jgi:hypothetical protein